MNWVEALRMPLKVDPPFNTLPSGIECRSDGRIAVLAIEGTSRIVGFRLASFDPALHLPGLLDQLSNTAAA